MNSGEDEGQLVRVEALNFAQLCRRGFPRPRRRPGLEQDEESIQPENNN